MGPLCQRTFSFPRMTDICIGISIYMQTQKELVAKAHKLLDHIPLSRKLPKKTKNKIKFKLNANFLSSSLSIMDRIRTRLLGYTAVVFTER